MLPALDQILDMAHPLVRLAALIDCNILDPFGSVRRTGSAQPDLPTRVVPALFILKHMHNLSGEKMRCCTPRWIENPYYQYFQ